MIHSAKISSELCRGSVLRIVWQMAGIARQILGFGIGLKGDLQTSVTA